MSPDEEPTTHGEDAQQGEAEQQGSGPAAADTPEAGGDPRASASAAGRPPQPDEELRRQVEEELRRARIDDFLLQAISGLLNLTARRLAKEDERDLEQARIGIDAIRAWVDLLPDAAARQVRNALSELQMLYAQLVESAPEGAAPGPSGAQGAPDSGGEEGAQREKEKGSEAPPPRRGQPPPKLWTPPGST